MAAAHHRTTAWRTAQSTRERRRDFGAPIGEAHSILSIRRHLSERLGVPSTSGPEGAGDNAQNIDAAQGGGVTEDGEHMVGYHQFLPGRAGSRKGVWRGLTRVVPAAALSAALALGVGAPTASAEDLRSTLETALRTNPDLQSQYETLRGLNEDVSLARSGLRPSLTGTGSAGYSYTDNSESFTGDADTRPTSVTVTASQPLFDGFQTQNAVKSAFAGVRSGRETVRQTEQITLLNAITAYIGVVQAAENVDLGKNDLRLNRRSLQAARDRFDVGEVTRTDVAQAEASLAASQANLAQQQGSLRSARETYLRAVGVRPGELAPLPPLPELPRSLEEAREIARRNHPSILAARAAVSSASFSVDQARGALLPQVDLQASGTAASESVNDTSGLRTASATVNVTVPFYQGGALRSNVRRNQALESQRFQELRSVTRQILESVGIAWEDLQTSRATIQSNRAAVRANQIALDGVREEAKVGSRTTLDVLEEQQRLLDSQVALVNSRSGEQVNAYTLLSAIGVLSIERLSLDVARPDVEAQYQSVQSPFSGTFDDFMPTEDYDPASFIPGAEGDVEFQD